MCEDLTYALFGTHQIRQMERYASKIIDKEDQDFARKTIGYLENGQIPSAKAHLPWLTKFYPKFAVMVRRYITTLEEP